VSTESSGGNTQNDGVGDLVRRFRVCWEVDPESASVNNELRKIGFSLQLFGTNELGTDNISPGSESCIVVQSALKRIIHSILHKDERLSRYEVTIDSQSLSYSNQRGNRPDAGANIRILHRDAWDQPIDDCEERCLKDMEQALGELGASKGAWRTI